MRKLLSFLAFSVALLACDTLEPVTAEVELRITLDDGLDDCEMRLMALALWMEGGNVPMLCATAPKVATCEVGHIPGCGITVEQDAGAGYCIWPQTHGCAFEVVEPAD